jgi:hypothetical protein
MVNKLSNIYLDFAEFTRRTLEKGTEVGFNKDEIIKTTTEDLLTLRKSIVLYLKSKKLKKRNANFMEVYTRINEELKMRKIINKKEEESVNFGFIKAEISPQLRKLSSAESSIDKEELLPEGKVLLQRKHSMALEVEIPSFLNDKKQRKEQKDSPKKKDEVEKPTLKACFNGKI